MGRMTMHQKYNTDIGDLFFAIKFPQISIIIKRLQTMAKRKSYASF